MTLLLILSGALLLGSGAAAPDGAATSLGPGGVELPGLSYRVLTSGPETGRRPLRGDDVTVRYEGRLLDGALFSASPDGGRAPVTFELQRLIPGWIAALQMMRPGDIWIIRLPPYLAYGERGTEKIPPRSVLTFKVELISSAPHPAAPSKP